MNTREAIRNRRAIKEYDAAHIMTEAEKKELLSLAMLAPTAYNIQNWRFVVVKDRDLREKIKEAAWGQAQVTDASLLIVMCADLNSWEKQPERYWADAGQQVQDAMLPMIDSYYRGKEQVQQDEAMRSCGMAAQNLMLSAKDMGYDSGPMDGFDYDQVGELIGLPEDHAIAMFVVIGKATRDAHPHGGQLAMEEIVINDRF